MHWSFSSEKLMSISCQEIWKDSFPGRRSNHDKTQFCFLILYLHFLSQRNVARLESTTKKHQVSIAKAQQLMPKARKRLVPALSVLDCWVQGHNGPMHACGHCRAQLPAQGTAPSTSPARRAKSHVWFLSNIARAHLGMLTINKTHRFLGTS